MKKHILLLLTCLTAGGLSAGTAGLGNRIGQIVAAEYSSSPVEFGDRKATLRPDRLPEERCIVLTLKMTPRRSLSLVDYNLKINGTAIPCVAVARNSGFFVTDPEALFLAENDVARLLFVVDGSLIKPVNGVLRATLQPVLRGRSPVSFTITDIGDKKFTEPAKIPPSGLLP